MSRARDVESRPESSTHMDDVLRSIPPIVLVMIVALAIAVGALVYSALTYDPPPRGDGYEDWESETW